ncbi:hypothetical protein PP637_gp44 [Arthrobacter phage Persistence]|uniref:Uncharacterized protein n=1 Tax=Arthrobacter phage Persistence TaxID=2836007 RepID=A0A8F3IM13_9CAUD|nr:hypothetical protein PP637_gp44 [Arthrobacter phage Persistence]QWY79674.1 hypothetical protein SEA_PERSISTENCE_44 [Arthrobacter phage Persistence]
MSATVKAVFGPSYLAFCEFCQDGERHRIRGRAEAWAEQHNAKEHAICEICEVDHATTWADLSHGIIRLMLHAQERITWQEWPINGDMIARQRKGILGPALLFSWADPEDIDWERVNSKRGDA